MLHSAKVFQVSLEIGVEFETLRMKFEFDEKFDVELLAPGNYIHGIEAG
jgi:hypothetical protein